jgi:hypothetical protein
MGDPLSLGLSQDIITSLFTTIVTGGGLGIYGINPQTNSLCNEGYESPN